MVNGILEAIDRPSVAGIWEPLLALSLRANASPEVGVLLAWEMVGSPLEIGVLLASANEERRTKRRKSSQRVRFPPTCPCDDCPNLHSYEHSREVRHAAMTNYCKFHFVKEIDEKKIAASALGITGWAVTNVLVMSILRSRTTIARAVLCPSEFMSPMKSGHDCSDTSIPSAQSCAGLSRPWSVRPIDLYWCH